MTFWAVVPVKPFQSGKSRLAGVLTLAERTALNSYLLRRTLETLNATPEIAHTLVVSRDPAALELAQAYQAQTILEDGSPQLNGALTQATQVVRSYADVGLLIIPADLPLVTPQDIQGLLEIVKKVDPSVPEKQPVVVIAPDRQRYGTNGLFVSPPGLISYHFGPNSFQRHCTRARQANARLEIYENPAFAFDLDLPEDLDRIKSDPKNWPLPRL